MESNQDGLVGPPPEEIPQTDAGQRQMLRDMGYDVAQYSPEEFAKAAVEFYNALVKLGLERAFAEKLTVAFVQRP
jgi:hypothetical protein